MNYRLPLRYLFVALLICSSTALLHAGTETSLASSDKSVIETKEDDNDSLYYKIWSIPKVYQNPDNPIIEEFDIIGRFQLDYFNVKSDRGSTSFAEIRRFRLGE